MARTPEEKRVYMREYRSRPSVQERSRQYDKEYRQRPETKERKRIRSKEWLDANPNQREKARQKTRQWNIENPDRKKQSDKKISIDRRLWIRSLKEGKSCAYCGFENVRTLEWHHRNSEEKSFNIAECKRSKDTILKEIEKCDLICANCHKIEHYIEVESEAIC